MPLFFSDPEWRRGTRRGLHGLKNSSLKARKASPAAVPISTPAILNKFLALRTSQRTLRTTGKPGGAPRLVGWPAYPCGFDQSSRRRGVLGVLGVTDLGLL